MFTLNTMFAFVFIIFNLHIIYCENEEYELPNIDYSFSSSEDSEPKNGDQNSTMPALDTVSNKIQDIKKALETKLKQLENNLNNTINHNLSKLKNQTRLENGTALQNDSKGKKTDDGYVRSKSKDSSESRLLHVSVPSEVRARPGVWTYLGTPAMDDLDVYMANVTGCQYTARNYYIGWLPVSSSSVGARWRRVFALRAQWAAGIRVTWGGVNIYEIWVGYMFNSDTRVFDPTRLSLVLKRATPGVMSQDWYTQFYYVQLEDGVMSFGRLGDTPWWQAHVPVSAGDVVQLEYTAWAYNGVKLLLCN